MLRAGCLMLFPGLQASIAGICHSSKTALGTTTHAMQARFLENRIQDGAQRVRTEQGVGATSLEAQAQVLVFTPAHTQPACVLTAPLDSIRVQSP